MGGGVLGGGVLGAGDVTDSWAERRVVVGPVFATITKDLFPTGVAAEVCTTIIRSEGDVPDRTCAETPGAKPTAVIENDDREALPTHPPRKPWDHRPPRFGSPPPTQIVSAP